MRIDIDSARNVINAIDKTVEFVTMLKKLTGEELDILIRSFEELQKELSENIKNKEESE